MLLWGERLPMPAHPGVAVVIPYFNDSATLERALASVREQSLSPSSILIVDDGSSQTEFAKLEAILYRYPDLPIRLLATGGNVGPSAARNLGWDAVTSEHVAFLDADDSWHPDKLRVQCAIMDSRPDLILLGTGSQFSHGELISSSSATRVNPVSTLQQLLRNRYTTSSVMVRSGCSMRFAPQLRYSEDNELWCRLLLTRGNGAVITQPLTYYHKPPRSGHGASGRYFSMLRGQLAGYMGLHRDSLISLPLLLTCLLSATARYARRMLLVAWDRLCISHTK